ncbi:MAG: hypothetical protein K2J76_02555 [Oscillospiraceae bacterium]|nr:hypothetical protein [Oscillospiraceae bacterium]
MSIFSKAAASKEASEKMVKIHVIIVVSVCIAFGIINAVTGTLVLGIIIAVAGAVLAVASHTVLAKTSTTFRGTIISQTQLLIIIIMSAMKHELHAMFPLMAASMTIAAIYYSKQNLFIHWALIDAAGILGIILRNSFYGGQDLEFIIKGLLGLNVCAAVIIYLVDCSLGYIRDSESSAHRANTLVDQVNEQMESSSLMAAQQREVVERIAEISQKVNESASLMSNISERISSAAEEQERTISQIADDITKISKETQKSFNESAKVSDAAGESTEMIRANNEEMQHMLTAMNDISDSSKKIESIIKTIEDIAFQTNILALNAAVEAARAGAAGKGFAVVADEVRNLATKSAEAANSTSALIKDSLTAVANGMNIANETAERMNGVIEYSEKSAEHAGIINSLTGRQVEAIASLKDKIEQISQVVAQNVQTSVESSEIARSVSEEVGQMDEIVSEFRG